MKIGVIGGTGREGRGLALRWARAGHQVTLGSRDAAKAKARAAELDDGRGLLSGDDNAGAVRGAEVVVAAVPYSAHAETLRALVNELTGKIVIDIAVPLKPPAWLEVNLPDGQSAALEAQAILGAGTPVIAALHHISSGHLGDLAFTIDCDVMLCGDDAKAKETAIVLIGELGVRAFDAGPLRNSIALESLTPVLMYLNKRYKAVGPGIRLTGMPPQT